MESMKHFIKSRAGLSLATGIGAGLILGGGAHLIFEPLVVQAQVEQKSAPKLSDVGEAQLDGRRIDDRLSDQAHAMADVGYHFSNLWFAADKQNWPLAAYSLGETRSHLKWAVRI